MKMQHRDCGGKITESGDTPPYNSDEHGIVPVYVCNKCSVEILGDSEIELIPENESDEIQLQSINFREEN